MELSKKEFSKEYYDKYYAESEAYHWHYSKLVHYPMWEEAIKLCGDNIFEIGCGSGQFANMVSDAKKNYMGFDASSEAIKIAMGLNLTYAHFDIRGFEDYVIYPTDYDTYVAFEILEHVKNDRGLLERIPNGEPVIFSVPNFDYASHVRLFENEKVIKERYKDLVNIKNICKFNTQTKGKWWYLCHGTKKKDSCIGCG